MLLLDGPNVNPMDHVSKSHQTTPISGLSPEVHVIAVWELALGAHVIAVSGLSLEVHVIVVSGFAFGGVLEPFMVNVLNC